MSFSIDFGREPFVAITIPNLLEKCQNLLDSLLMTIFTHYHQVLFENVFLPKSEEFSHSAHLSP